MTVYAVTMVRDEADIIEATVRNIAAQVHHVIVADNGSTDGTRDILADLARDIGIDVVDDPERGYWQSRKITALAHRAGDMGADWIVPFDADEVWYCPHGPIADHLAGVGPSCFVASAAVYDHVSSSLDPADPNPVTRISWRHVEPLPLPKVACRWRPDLNVHQGNHGADYGGMTPAAVPLLVVRHFPYRSAEQFVRKVRNGSEAYRATDLPADVGAHWRQWGDILDRDGEEAVADIYRRWFWRQDPTRKARRDGEILPRLIFDPAPCAA